MSTPESAQPAITNIVVVMLENRSYDNILGWLYNSGNAPPYNQAPGGQSGLNGLTGSETNPNPDGGTIQVSNAASTTVPTYDPGEGFCDMAQQIFGLPKIPTSDPYTATPVPAMTMEGFVTNYADLKNLFGKPIVPEADYPDCMTYFTPAQVPVTAWLANNFAVCDQWYASVPCQTFTNRNFAICAGPGVASSKSYSLVNDLQYAVANAIFGTIENTASIFQALDAAYPASDPPNWKLYYFDYSIAAMIVPYVYQAAASSTNVNVSTYDESDWSSGGSPPIPTIIGKPLGLVPPTFVADLAAGTLPKLSFIEPRYATDVANSANPPNSNHPGDSALLPFLPGSHEPIDVANGEAFLAEVYNALYNSPYWENTLLIVTYDEHGGMYDHVTPATNAASPGAAFPAANDIADPCADGFEFNYFGCRVPAIIVSPFIQAGTTISPPANSAPFDHTSIIKTVWECFNLPAGGSLTQRDLAAPSLMTCLMPTASNNPGPYSGANAAASSPIRTGQPAIVPEMTPEKAQALFNARLTKSMRARVPRPAQ